MVETLIAPFHTKSCPECHCFNLIWRLTAEKFYCTYCGWMGVVLEFSIDSEETVELKKRILQKMMSGEWVT